MSKTYSAGIVTAYGAAKRAGYTGTYEDFCRQQAQYAQNASAIEQAKQTAVSASQSANQAKQDAQTASTTAQQSAQSAQGSAQSAGQSAQDAQTAESNAQTYAQSASQSAGSAQQSAQSAQAVLESIPEDYSDLSEDVDKLKADLADIVQADYLFNDSFNKSERIASGQFTNQNATIESDLPCTGGSVLYVTYNVNVTVNPNIFSSLTLQCVEFDANNNVLKRTFDFDNPLTLKTNTTHIALHITYSYNNTESRYTEIFTGNISVRNGDLTLNEDITIPQIRNMFVTDGEEW